jgi:hypothetical protein
VLPPPDEASTTLFVGSDRDDDDEEWTATFGDQTASIEYDRLQQSQLKKTELDRFMNDSLDTSITTTMNYQIVKHSLINKPLRWRRERGEHLYPTLAGMAYYLFAIPAMSSECERAFSSTKRLITDQRYSLKSDIIEADQCVKSWFKHGVADGEAAFTTISAIDHLAMDERICIT